MGNKLLPADWPSAFTHRTSVPSRSMEFFMYYFCAAVVEENEWLMGMPAVIKMWTTAARCSPQRTDHLSWWVSVRRIGRFCDSGWLAWCEWNATAGNVFCHNRWKCQHFRLVRPSTPSSSSHACSPCPRSGSLSHPQQTQTDWQLPVMNAIVVLIESNNRICFVMCVH